MLKSKKWTWLTGLTLVSLILAACGPSTTPTAQVVEVTKIVAGTPQTVVITATPAPVEPPAAEGPIAAEGLVACNPVPELPSSASTAGSVTLASYTVPRRAAAARPAGVASQAASSAAGLAQQAGQVYRVGIFEDITSSNFFAANGPDNTVWNAYVDQPFRISAYGLADKTFQFVPSIAADMPSELTQEGDFWVSTVPLRQDVKWSDGEPVTAADWAFTADTALKFGLISGNWATWYDSSYLDHIEAVDDYTAKVVYHTKPGLARHQFGVLTAPILAEHFWAPLAAQAAAPLEGLTKPAADASEADKTAYAEKETEAQNNLYGIDPSGEPLAGAYTFVKWERGAFVEENANPGFYGANTTVTLYADGTYQETQAGVSTKFYGEGTGDKSVEYTVGPHVASAIYTVYGSQDAAILALKAGEIDFLLNPLGLQRGLLAQVQGDSNVTVISNNTNGFRYLSFNTRRQPMNDCAFRQAIAVLIDKEFVTRTILQGVAFPLYSFVPEANEAWFFDEVLKLGQGLDREQRTNLAVAILEQAGYTWEGDVKPAWDADNRQVTPGGRLIMPDGTPVPPLTMLAPSPGYDPLRSTFAIWIETWANEFGIPLRAQLQGFNVIVPKIFTEQNFDMYILGWSLSIFPDYVRDFFHTEQAVTDGNNAGGYSNPEFDAAADELLTCTEVEACKEIADKLQLILSQELPYVVLFDTGIIETYRSAAVEYPFTEYLSGLQYMHQGAGGSASVNVK